MSWQQAAVALPGNQNKHHTCKLIHQFNPKCFIDYPSGIINIYYNFTATAEVVAARQNIPFPPVLQLPLVNTRQPLQDQQKHKLQMRLIRFVTVVPHRCGEPQQEVMETQCQNHL